MYSELYNQGHFQHRCFQGNYALYAENLFSLPHLIIFSVKLVTMVGLQALTVKLALQLLSNRLNIS